MGVGRGRVAGATIAAPFIGINTATATGSTAADIFMAAGSSTGSSTDRSAAADISTAAGSSTGPGTAPDAGADPDTGADSCRGLEAGSSATDNSDSADALSSVAEDSSWVSSLLRSVLDLAQHRCQQWTLSWASTPI